MGATYCGSPVDGAQKRIRRILADFPRRHCHYGTASCGGRMATVYHYCCFELITEMTIIPREGGLSAAMGSGHPLFDLQS